MADSFAVKSLERKTKPSNLLKKNTAIAAEALAIKPSKSSGKSTKVKAPQGK